MANFFTNNKIKYFSLLNVSMDNKIKLSSKGLEPCMMKFMDTCIRVYTTNSIVICVHVYIRIQDHYHVYGWWWKIWGFYLFFLRIIMLKYFGFHDSSTVQGKRTFFCNENLGIRLFVGILVHTEKIEDPKSQK